MTTAYGVRCWHVANKKTLAKSQKDKKREYVLREMDAQRMTAVEAARSLGLSERQVRRLLAAYRQEGAAAVVHGNRGQTPINALAPDVRQTILDLAQTTYVGFNQTHFTEKLQTEHGSPSHGQRCSVFSRTLASRVHVTIVAQSIALAGSGDRDPGCCCRSMAVAMIGWKGAGLV